MFPKIPGRTQQEHDQNFIWVFPEIFPFSGPTSVGFVGIRCIQLLPHVNMPAQHVACIHVSLIQAPMVMVQDKQKRLYCAPSRSCTKHYPVGGGEALPRQSLYSDSKWHQRSDLFMVYFVPILQTETFSTSKFYESWILRFLFVSNFCYCHRSNRPTGHRSIAGCWQRQRASTSIGIEWMEGNCVQPFSFICKFQCLGLDSAVGALQQFPTSICERVSCFMNAPIAVLLFHFPISRCAFDVCLTIEWFRSIRRR